MYLDTWNVVAGSASDTGGLGGLGISLGDASDILQLVSRRQNEVKKKPRPSQEYIIEKFSKPMGIKPKRNRVISMDEEIQVGLGNVSDERFDVSMDDFDFDTDLHNVDSNKLISNTDAVNDYKKSNNIYANENNVDYDNNLDDAVNNNIGLNSDNATEEKLTEESYELYNSLFSGNVDTMRNEDYADDNEYDPLDELDFGDDEDDYGEDDEGYEEDYVDPLDELDFEDEEDGYSEDDEDDYSEDELEPPIMEKAVINQHIQVVTPVEQVNNPKEIVEPKNASQVHDPLDELDFEDEEEDNYDPLDELDWEDEYTDEDYDEADEEDDYDTLDEDVYDPLEELDFEDEEDDPAEYTENNKVTSTIIKEAQPVIKPTVITKEDKLVDVQSAGEIQDESLTLVSDREKELQERLAKARLKQEQARLKQLEEEVLAAEAEADRLEAENKAKATKISSNTTKEQKKVVNTITKKDDSIDKLINNQSKRQTKVIKEKEKFSGDSVKRKPSKIDMYSAMKDNELYLEVRKFLKSREIQRKPVNIKELNEEFGADNIRKLLTRSYLISTGKGVTVGR